MASGYDLKRPAPKKLPRRLNPYDLGDVATLRKFLAARKRKAVKP